MVTIRDMHECQQAIEMCRFFEEMLPLSADPERTQNRINDYKRAYRAYLNQASDRRIVKSDGDGCILRIQVPGSIQTEEAAQDWFESRERMECRPSQYDCTGQLFTCWHKIVRIGGQLVCYHCIGIDV